jgi:hypothetical protein
MVVPIRAPRLLKNADLATDFGVGAKSQIATHSGADVRTLQTGHDAPSFSIRGRPASSVAATSRALNASAVTAATVGLNESFEISSDFGQ